MTPLAPSLAKVARGDLCAGCGACAALAPDRVEMQLSEGWLRPVQTGPLEAETDARIARVCPGLGMNLEAEGREDDPLWGPIMTSRSGYAADPALRRQGASGGALSALLTHLLETGEVDRVLQTAADPEAPLANLQILSADADGVFRAAGSRYAPSSPLEKVEKLLAGSERLAFVGKPCDVAALRALGREDPRVGERFPYMLSFFCAGVPSLRGAEAVLTALGAPKKQTIAFRYRGDGWPGRATATLADGSTRSMTYAESWGGILSAHTQFRCKICPDGIGSFADAVCADAWETDDNGYPLFEEREGVSLILSRTGKGEDLVQAALAAGRLNAEPQAIEEIAAMQPGQRNRKRAVAARLAALAVLGRPRPRYRGFRLLAAARQAPAKTLLRNFAGALRRVLRPRPAQGSPAKSQSQASPPSGR